MTHEEIIIKQNIEIIQQNDFIIKMLKAALPDAGKNLWMNEEDVLQKLGVGKTTLRNYRMENKFIWRFAGKGRKIQYQRKSVEEYLTKQSTVPLRKIA